MPVGIYKLRKHFFVKVVRPLVRSLARPYSPECPGDRLPIAFTGSNMRIGKNQLMPGINQ
jgi:hypothetical protein